MAKKIKSKNPLLKLVLKDVESPLGFSNNFTIVIVGLLMLVIGLGGGYILFGQKGYPVPIESPTNINMTSPSPSTVVEVTEMRKTYTSPKYGFSLKYPQSWNVEDNAYGDEIYSVFSAGDTDLLIVYGEVPGRGCGPVDDSLNKSAIVQFGDSSMTIHNFCGSNTYILGSQNASKKYIAIDVNFLGTAFEAEGREVLNSVTGLIPSSK